MKNLLVHKGLTPRHKWFKVDNEMGIYSLHIPEVTFSLSIEYKVMWNMSPVKVVDMRSI